jgi:hypothetical protein
MPTGILGRSSPNQQVNTIVYTVPASKLATFTVNIVNRDSTESASVRLAISSTNTPANSEWIEYNTTLLPNCVLERTGLVAQAGENVVIYSSTSLLSISVYGYEE